MMSPILGPCLSLTAFPEDSASTVCWQRSGPVRVLSPISCSPSVHPLSPVRAPRPAPPHAGTQPSLWPSGLGPALTACLGSVAVCGPPTAPGPKPACAGCVWPPASPSCLAVDWTPQPVVLRVGGVVLQVHWLLTPSLPRAPALTLGSFGKLLLCIQPSLRVTFLHPFPFQ